MLQDYDRDTERQLRRGGGRRRDYSSWMNDEVAFEPFLFQYGVSGTQGRRKDALGIFTRDDLPDAESTARFREGLDANFRFAEPTLFDRLRDAEGSRRAQALPTNGFEDLINLTKEGKIWKFPIDNEQVGLRWTR